MKRAVLIVALLVVAACGGGGGSGGGTPQHPPVAAPLTTNATLRIVVPNEPSGSAARRPAFISSGTQSIGVAVQTINGVAPSPQPSPTIVALTPSNPACTTGGSGTSCTVTITVPIAASVVLAISSYASTDGSGTPIATGLTSAVNTSQSGASFAVTLGGVPATIVLNPTTLQANQDGTTQTLTFTVSAQDATGATIIPPGAYTSPIALSVGGDPNGALGISPNSVASPASGGTTITVTYTSSRVLPGAATINAIAGSAIAHVTFTPLGSGTGSLTAGYRIFEYPIPTANSQPYGITAGPGDGAIWFTENSGKVAKLFPSTCTTSGTLSCTIIEGSLPQAIGPSGIAAGQDGNMWIGGNLASATNHLYIMQPTSACASATNSNLNSCAITAQPDPESSPIVGDVRAGTDSLVHAAMSTSSEIFVAAFYPVSLPAAEYSGEAFVSSATGLTTFGLSNNQWFTSPGTDQVGIEVCYEGCQLTTYPYEGDGLPQGIVNAPNGNLYIADSSSEIVALPASSCSSECSFTTYSIPTASSAPTFLAIGADGNIWFTESTGNKIGIFNPTTHKFTELTVPTANAQPWGITLGPDGNIWFTEIATGKIGVVMP